jgi:hypothetical protein
LCSVLACRYGCRRRQTLSSKGRKETPFAFALASSCVAVPTPPAIQCEGGVEHDGRHAQPQSQPANLTAGTCCSSREPTGQRLTSSHTCACSETLFSVGCWVLLLESTCSSIPASWTWLGFSLRAALIEAPLVSRGSGGVMKFVLCLERRNAYEIQYEIALLWIHGEA